MCGNEIQDTVERELKQWECKRKNHKIEVIKSSFYVHDSLLLLIFIYNRGWKTFSVKG